MAKKKTSSKKKTARTKRAPSRAASKPKKTARKTGKKTARKATTKRPTKKKTAAGKSSTKKKKTAAKTKRPAKKASTKKAATKAPSKKKTTTKKTARKVAEKPSASSKRTKKASGPIPDSDGYVIINGRRVRMMSAASAVPARKISPRAAPAEAADNSKTRNKPVKTRLNKKQLEHFRGLLLAKRAELIGDLSALEEQALSSGGSNSSHMPIHMADIGSDTYDQDFMLNLAETERRGLREIDEALQRITDGTYGICQLTGKPIPIARLNAKPWAKYTVEAARMIESGMSA